MKKYLISLCIISGISLLSIIYIQVAWLKLNMEQEQRFLNQNIIKILRNVGETISKDIILKYKDISDSLQTASLDSKLLEDNKEFFFEMIDATKGVKKSNLQMLLKTYLKQDGYQALEFQFGIVKNNRALLSSLKSNNDFLKLLNDTTENRIYGYPINYKLHVKNLNNIDNIEVLYLVVKNTKQFVLQKIAPSLALMILFAIVILTGIYITISFILKQEHVEEMQTHFINNMTHEFKTPIATISIATKSIQHPNTIKNKEDIIHYTKIIQTENARMLEMVELILSHATVSKGEIRLTMQPMSMHDLLEKILQKLQLLLDSKNTQLNATLNASNDIVMGDSVQLLIALSNLVENAIKYTKNDLKLNIQTSNDNGYFILSIKDNGIGIHPKHLKHLFKKFYRVGNENMHNVKGFGLGLSYTKSITEAHKGNIKVKSTLGVGTTFTVQIPSFSIPENEEYA